MGALGQNTHFSFHSKESFSQLKFHYRKFKKVFIQNKFLFKIFYCKRS